jgi:hypothetical protein
MFLSSQGRHDALRRSLAQFQTNFPARWLRLPGLTVPRHSKWNFCCGEGGVDLEIDQQTFCMFGGQPVAQLVERNHVRFIILT